MTLFKLSNSSIIKINITRIINKIKLSTIRLNMIKTIYKRNNNYQFNLNKSINKRNNFMNKKQKIKDQYDRALKVLVNTIKTLKMES